MKFNLYRKYGALNSPPIFDAFESGIKSLGHTVSNDVDAVPVIWSVLWNGRMAPNEKIYRHAIKNDSPIIIIEVGNLKRGITWRISYGHVNRLGQFGNLENLDFDRPKRLGFFLKPLKIKRNYQILITTQHQKSLQWDGMPRMDQWIYEKVREIKKFTDRPIIVRCHPRSPLTFNSGDFKIEIPKKIPNSYDDFDINYNYHCVINHNSGPGVQAAVNGVPVICDQSSLAFDVSDSIENIENIRLADRDDWFIKLTHTEWTLDEIARGIPLSRLESYLKS